MFNKQMKNGAHGFTLIEILITTTIISIGLLAIATMQIRSTKGNATARNMTEAAIGFESMIESFMALPYDDLSLVDKDGDGINGLDDALPHNSGDSATADYNQTIGGKYTIFWNVADNAPIDNVKTIRIITTWKEQKNKRIIVDYFKADII